MKDRIKQLESIIEADRKEIRRLIERYEPEKAFWLKVYKPRFLSWCESYDQEEKEIRELIEGEPDDVKMLKKEYEELTGKRYRRVKA